LSSRSLNLETTILTLITAFVAEQYGYVWVSLILSCLSVFLLIRELDWPRESLGIQIPRWQFWFSLECVSFFFFFSVFGMSSKGYFMGLAESSVPISLPLWIVFYMFLWLVSPLIVFLRHDYLVPRALKQYLSEKKVTEYDALRHKLWKLEGGVLVLCAISGFGFSDYLDLILLSVTVFLVVRKMLMKRETSKSSCSTMLIEDRFDRTERRFWTRFAKASNRLNGTFFILSFVFFLNLPSLNPYSYAELVTLLLMATCLIIILIGIQSGLSIRKIASAVTLCIVLLLAFTVMKGDPAVLPFIRRFTGQSFEAQSFWLFTQLLFLFIGLFNLDLESRGRAKNQKASMATKLKNLAREAWFYVVVIAYVVTLIWSYTSIPLPQIKLITIVGLALLITVPCFKDMRI
jgi:hypothetical protein